MYANICLLVFAVLVVAVHSIPAGYFSDNEVDDGLRRALLSVQRQRRQMTDRPKYYDPSLSEYFLSGGFAPKIDDDKLPVDSTATRDEIPYGVVLEEIIRRMKENKLTDSKALPVGEGELSGIFEPPNNANLDDEITNEPSKPVSENELTDLFDNDESSNDNIQEDSGRQGDGKENNGVSKRSESPVIEGDFPQMRDESSDADSKDQVDISYDQLQAELVEQENKQLMDALDLATLSQITASSALIPKEIESIKKAIEIEDLLQDLDDEGDDEPNDAIESKRGGERVEEDVEEPVLERVHHAQRPSYLGSLENPNNEYGKFPWQQIVAKDTVEDECPVSSYDFSCGYAAGLGEEFVDLCRRHDICYSCGEFHGITREGCDEGFLGEGEELCEDDWCKVAAAKLFLQMQRDHKRVPDVDDLQQCTDKCIETFIVFGDE